jgi:hypothetical protein
MAASLQPAQGNIQQAWSHHQVERQHQVPALHKQHCQLLQKQYLLT